MYCDRCGTQVQEAQRFCPSCGKANGTVPMMPVQSRLAGHVRLAGILWLAFSALHLLPGFFLFSIMGGHYGFPPEMPIFVHGILRMVGGFILLCGALGIIAGWGLLERRPWARTMAIVLAICVLFSAPFGTALGIYTLWVLLPARSEQEYRAIARAA